jgi:endonuclease YncB( thermonuclease family)
MRIVSNVVALLVVIAVAVPAHGQGEAASVPVVRVLSGDTIEVAIGGVAFRVRYLGIEAPPAGHPCFEQARLANEALVMGWLVRLERDVSEADATGALLRYVYAGNTQVNAVLVRQGWAVARAVAPDTRYAAEFEALEADARAAGLGCLGVEPPAADTPAPTPTPDRSEARFFSVVTERANVRACPLTTCDVLTSIPRGTTVAVVGQVRSDVVFQNPLWYEVVTTRGTAYIHASLLAPLPAQPTPVPTPTATPAPQPTLTPVPGKLQGGQIPGVSPPASP